MIEDIIEKDILKIFNNQKDKIFTTGQIVKIIKKNWDIISYTLIHLDCEKKIASIYYEEDTHWGIYETILKFRKEKEKLETNFLYSGEEIYEWESKDYILKYAQ